jgi:hypothetical protein
MIIFLLLLSSFLFQAHTDSAPPKHAWVSTAFADQIRPVSTYFADLVIFLADPEEPCCYSPSHGVMSVGREYQFSYDMVGAAETWTIDIRDLKALPKHDISKIKANYGDPADGKSPNHFVIVGTHWNASFIDKQRNEKFMAQGDIEGASRDSAKKSAK